MKTKFFKTMAKHLRKFTNRSGYNTAKDDKLLRLPSVSLIDETKEVIYDPYVEPTLDMVDLGLSVLWGRYNLGAESETARGDYYAWGEVETKSDYSWATYSRNFVNGTYSNNNEKVFIKYCNSLAEDRYWAGDGHADNKLVLDSEDDVVTTLYGSRYRIPTAAEFTELINGTDVISEPFGPTGRHGWKCYKKTDHSVFIFLPKVGYYDGSKLVGDVGLANYWTSTLTASPGNSDSIYYAISALFNTRAMIYSSYRCYGLPIRPVCSLS